MKNVCVVGYGNVGPIHAKELNSLEMVNLYAVCDINVDRCKACRTMYDVIEYNDYDEMLLDENVDSIHICTPHYLHYDMIKKAIEANKEVVVEKPIVRTKEEFEQLQDHKGAEKVAVVMQNRLNPCVQKLKKVIQCEEYGRVKAVKGILTWHRNKDYYACDSWRGKWQTEGGGLLINQAIHTLDLFSYLIGDIRRVNSNLCNYSLNGVIEVEDTLSAYLEFENDVKGIFFATNAYPVNSELVFEVVFEKALARYIDKKLYINDVIVEEDESSVIGKSYWGTGHKELIRRYYEEGRYFSIADITNTMNVVYGIYDDYKKLV